ncbi:F420-dependent NADP oxidoreductase [Labrys okinawensis]|uniref:F420-dependent NADP oxidoreductase n=1 Tax=Labrys okinawensis TaxID=346911 RepID=A0A2S9QEP5_9HYPH|nr:pyrroline-5-carboxylate reductase [Labrys okinawensis]PRH87817.1 F420-dependent NADP oxidoreductase [Labrys okinawensis]
MKLGFIGTGALTSAIVTGLKSVADNDVAVVLSPRNEAVAADLASRFADVRVAADNQAVLDACDTIMLAVRPQIAHDVLAGLQFRPAHRIISLIATLSLEEIAALVSPAERVTKALPMVAQRQGPTIIYPPDPDVVAFFARFGKAFAVKDVTEFDALSVATATFATYFKYLDTLHGWLQGHGVSDPTARSYVSALFKALAQAPEAAPDTDFMHLAQEYATRGGINEQVLRELTDRKLFEAFAESLDGVHRRISGI